MIWKTEECRVNKNIALKHDGENPEFHFVALLFTLLT